MKRILLVPALVMLSGCGDTITADELEKFFRKHKVNGNYAVAIKKRSVEVAYLATVHGYPNNRTVCEQLIAPYNKDPSLSVIPGEYYCEELR